MSPPFSNPKDAIVGLIEAYRGGNIDVIAHARDFDADSRIFWHGLSLPISDEQLSASAAAFEINFRRQLDEDGIPDYEGVTFCFPEEEQAGNDLVVVAVECSAPEHKSVMLRIPVMNTRGGWKVVLHPGYDQL